MARLTDADRNDTLTKLRQAFPSGFATKTQLKEWATMKSLPPPRWIWKDPSRVLDKGRFSLAETVAATPVTATDLAPAPVLPALMEGAGLITRVASADDQTGAFIPPKDPTFVPFGFYFKTEKLIASKIFFPVYFTGQSGLGKTANVIEACARLGREMVRVNITKDTDEIDLFGSYELIDGTTVRKEGPVITAMRRGAVLLLDETDYGSERILCLQPILEGKPFLDKKTNTIVYPQPGFQIFATANTKGKGSSDGRFVGANVLNEAFLERFAITVECDYPPEDIEKQILQANFKQLGLSRKDPFIDPLVKWAAMIRKNFSEGSMADIISTRRLVHISRAFAVFGTRKEAIELCLNRFEDTTKNGFLDLYKMLDDKFEEVAPIQVETREVEPEADTFVPPPATTAPPPIPVQPPAPTPAPTTRAPRQQLPTPSSTSRGPNDVPTDAEVRAIQAELRVKFGKTIMVTNATNAADGSRVLRVQVPMGNNQVKDLVFPLTQLPTGTRDLCDALILVIKANI